MTGLRVGEALRHHLDDVDLHTGLFHVCQSKFGKSRHVPVHDSTVDALVIYARRRDERPPLNRSLPDSRGFPGSLFLFGGPRHPPSPPIFDQPTIWGSLAMVKVPVIALSDANHPSHMFPRS